MSNSLQIAISSLAAFDVLPIPDPARRSSSGNAAAADVVPNDGGGDEGSGMTLLLYLLVFASIVALAWIIAKRSGGAGKNVA